MNSSDVIIGDLLNFIFNKLNKINIKLNKHYNVSVIACDIFYAIRNSIVLARTFITFGSSVILNTYNSNYL
jgi:hypothetical protein